MDANFLFPIKRIFRGDAAAPHFNVGDHGVADAEDLGQLALGQGINLTIGAEWMWHSATHGSSSTEKRNTLCSTDYFATSYSPLMDRSWVNWWKVVAKAKADARAEGTYGSDEDKAQAVSAILERHNCKGIKRALLNFWTLGKRTNPTLEQFFAVCEVMKIDPRTTLFGESKATSSENGNLTNVVAHEVEPATLNEDKILADLRIILDEERIEILARIERAATVARRYQEKFGPSVSDAKVEQHLPLVPKEGGAKKRAHSKEHQPTSSVPSRRARAKKDAR